MHWRNSLLFLLCTLSVQAAHVINNSGRQINGTHIAATADGSVILTTASGQKMTFRKGQYRSAVADRPKELVNAVALLKEGNGGQAVLLLKKVKADYRYLAWDQKAVLLLANHFYESEQYALAAAEFQTLENPTPDVLGRLRDSLVKSGETESVLKVLNEDIANGDRESAARAYLMRGDLKATGGDSAGARRDWLKVATFFKSEQELAQKAEANLKEK